MIRLRQLKQTTATQAEQSQTSQAPEADAEARERRENKKEKRRKKNMKTPRFIKEYANFKIENLKYYLKENQNPDGIELLKEKIETVKKTVRLFERGYITVDEAMKSIAE